MAERVVKVRLSAQVSEYEQGMLAAARATRTVGTEAEKLEQKKQAFEQLGRGLVVTGAALTAVTALSVKAAAGWESAWAGVTKTVEGTPEQLARVEDGLRGLTSVLPATHDEIAAVAEAAGQLGIETENVVSFTRTMIDMGETTNLSADSAATAIARFTNIMGTQQDKVSNLGSAIVGLGNNYATTEAEIMEMAMRLAGAGKQIGLTEGEVLGLSTALSSVGIEAEAGGSAMSKVMIDIAANVESGGEKLDKFAATAGMSADAFSKLWKQDSAAALSAFVKGLAGAEAQGQSTLGVLADLGITEVRMRDALLRSSAAADQFSQAMADGNTAFEENNALTLEAAKRYETVESKIAIAGNAVRDAAIDFGQVFLPAVGSAAEALTEFAGFMGDLPDPVQGILGVLTTAVGVIALTGGTALLAVPKIAEFKSAMETLGISMRTVGLVGGGAIVALTALVTVVGAVAAAQAEARQRAESYADTLAEGTNKITKATREMVAANLSKGTQYFFWENPSAFDAAEALGVSLGLVTEAGMGSAEALRELDNVLNGLKPDTFADSREMEAYQNRVENITNAVAREAGSLDEAARMNERKERATRSASDASRTSAEVYQDEASAVADLAGELSKLIDTINEANGVGQDAVTTNARWQSALSGISEEVQRQKDAYEQANGTLEGFQLSLDEATAAGSANAASLSDAASAAQAAAEAQFELDQKTMGAEDATQKYVGTLQAQREAFINSAVEAGYNAEEIQKLADKVFALPDAKEIQILTETAQAQADLDYFITQNNGRTIRVSVAADGTSIDMGNITVGIPGQAAGGPVVGSGPKGVDSELRMLAPGEHVITAGEVDAAGGHAAVQQWRSSLLAGGATQTQRSVGVWMQAGQHLGVLGGGGGSGGGSADSQRPIIVNQHFNVPEGMTPAQVKAISIDRLDTELRK